MLQAGAIQCLIFLGRWREAAPTIPELLQGGHDQPAIVITLDASNVAAACGDDAMLAHCVAVAGENRATADLEYRAVAHIVLAREAFERDNPREALDLLMRILAYADVAGEIGTSAYVLAVDAAFGVSSEDAVAELLASLDHLPPVRVGPVRRAQRARLLAERAHHRGEVEAAQSHEREAVELLEAVGAKPFLAGALLDIVRRRGDTEALAQVRAIYAELGATRWLERIERTAEVSTA
jgi:hypothetical protein